ncbi:glycosyltransferase family 4 protein [Actinomyces sp. 565]|uniref:glycosyltransferase family 4 protein n=1 Tax=Actinomyces sp. 565 TaxID=2057794 RepID=UPI0013A6905F|nr:glycosyltransferase family 4 protein [Actinomyces sp. 565]
MKVLHVNDVARIGSALVRQARSIGLDWTLYDTARVDPRWSPRTRALRRALRGAAWEAGLARRALASDLLDIHGATVTAHTRWLRRPYVLHLHGTDIRVRRYEPAYTNVVERAVREALDVYYTTPDLAEHVLDLAPAATLQPVIVDVGELPRAVDTAAAPPRILFPSRWDAAKGGDMQLELLAALRDEHGDQIVLEGLDWGENAATAARDFGVVLRQRMTHDDYARWLGSGSLAVGQMSGYMSISELEAIATGTTTVMALNSRWYDGSHSTTRDVPVLGGVTAPERLLETTLEGVREALAGARVQGGREWVEANHSPARAVERLQERFALVSGS